MKIENEEQLAEAKRDLQAFERYCPKQSNVHVIRAAISEYENRPARIAAGLSEKAKARLVYLGTGNSHDSVIKAADELRSNGLEDKLRIEATTLGLEVLAELQNVKPPVGLKYEVVLLGFGEATNRGFFIDKSSAIFVMEQLKARYKECKYEIRKL